MKDHVKKRTFNEIGMHLQMIYGDDKVVKYMVFIFIYFLPHINFLTLQCFVAEVRWLFPVNRQEYWKSTKQQNIEPWWELNKNAAITEIKLRAHHSNSAEYLKVNVLFLYIVCLVCLFPISYMVIMLQIVYSFL